MHLGKVTLVRLTRLFFYYLFTIKLCLSSDTGLAQYFISSRFIFLLFSTLCALVVVSQLDFLKLFHQLLLFILLTE